MRQIQLFNVAPRVPEEIAFLETLAHNLWWCWNLDAIELFRRINPQLWRECSHNPLIFLAGLPQKRLEQLPKEEGFMSHLASVKSRFEKTVVPYLDAGSEQRLQRCIAYLSLEFGIHESLRFYSGGLGGLAGDHLKSASDMNIPLVGIGLFYRQGYFQQWLNNDGWQQETYPENELHHMPLSKALSPEGKPVQITVPLPEGPLKAIVWRVDIGRVPLFMMDANIQDNSPEFRRITAQLYSGDRKMRLRQELLLGIGGYRALQALGYDPNVIHMNEGHAAFVSLPRITHLTKDLGMDKKEALQVVNKTSVFTTHTPVPAGNETFDIGLLRPHLEVLRHELNLEPDEIISWGQSGSGSGQQGHEISMTILGLRMARFSNGVSELHGRVARTMWKGLWPELPEDEVPIIHITNGVHVPSWLSPDNSSLFDRYLGTDWRDKAGNEENLAQLLHIPDEELWRAHELGRSRLVRVARDINENSLRHRNATKSEVAHSKSILDQDALTIGFARRFATYKRGNLLLRDPERIIAMLTNQDRPVQLVFAGKAHPADDAGKDFIRQIVHFSKKANLSRRIVFLENYDIYVARTMVQGVDVWLNTPRRPLEASGTSGMKAALNGALHVSVLDGWWCEGFSKESGWAIGHGEEYDDPNYQDTVEALALYNLLENEIVPTFYDRQASDIPLRWLKMMKASIHMALGYFSSHRMVSEYSSLFYKPAKEQYDRLTSDHHSQAKALVKHHDRLAALWHRIKLTMPVTDRDISSLHVGDSFTVASTVQLVDLQPDEVEVQVYYGPVNSENQILESHVYPMTKAEDLGNGRYIYRHDIVCKISGRYAFSARVVPAGTDCKNSMPGFITWASGNSL